MDEISPSDSRHSNEVFFALCAPAAVKACEARKTEHCEQRCKRDKGETLRL